MTSLNSLLCRTPVWAAIALAFPAASFAQSTFSASGSYSIGADTANGTSKPKSGSFTIPTTTGPTGQSAVGASTSYWDSTATVSAGTYGNGQFGSAVSTSESYGSRSPMQTTVSVVYSDSIVNSSGAAQAASFTLAINSLQFGFDYGTLRGENAVSFSAGVYVDGSNVPVWSTSFRYDNGGVTASYSTGQDIGLTTAPSLTCSYHGDPSCSFGSGGFGISNYQTTIALGTVADGASIGVRYVVDIGTETNMYGGDASVTFNDPSRLGVGQAAAALSLQGATATVAAVPEPETYLMMAAGLGLLGATVRRRRAR